MIAYSGNSLPEKDVKALGLPFRQEISAPSRLLSFEIHKLNTGVEGEDKDYISDCELVPCVACTFITVFDKESMSSYLKVLKSRYKKVPFALVINYPGHTVQIGFDGLNWLSVNHDATVYAADKSFADVLDNILISQYLCGSSWCANVNIVLRKPDDGLAAIFHSIQVNKKNFVSLAGAQKQLCMILALRWGHSETLKTAMEILVGMRKEGTVSEEEFCKLAAAKRADGIPGLFLALHEGQSKTVKAFMEVLASMR